METKCCYCTEPLFDDEVLYRSPHGTSCFDCNRIAVIVKHMTEERKKEIPVSYKDRYQARPSALPSMLDSILKKKQREKKVFPKVPSLFSNVEQGIAVTPEKNSKINLDRLNAVIELNRLQINRDDKKITTKIPSFFIEEI